MSDRACSESAPEPQETVQKLMIHDQFGHPLHEHERHRADEQGDQGIQGVVQGPSERVTVRVLSRLKYVAHFLRTQGGPHQRPAEEQTDEHDGRQQAANQDEDPDERGRQDSHIETQQPADGNEHKTMTATPASGNNGAPTNAA